MEEIDARLMAHPACELGEGVQWRVADQRLYFTDILGRRLLSCGPDGEDLRETPQPEPLASFAFDPDGAMLAAYASGLFRYDPESGRRERLTRFEPEAPSTRLNDGRCDRQGRFLVGGVEQEGLRPVSSLTRAQGPAAQTERLFGGVSCSNGLAFSPDGRLMYHADSPTREIAVYPYAPETGALGERRVFARLGADQGVPDGSCVAADGALWNAEFDGGAVQEYRPDGALGRRVRVGAPKVTCCCFGGPKLDRLYVTTAWEHMSAEERAAEPLSGALFVAEVGAVGLPEQTYAARLFPEAPPAEAML